MKKLIALSLPFFTALLLATTVLATNISHAAEIRYVSDELRVPMRSSPCNSCKIIHFGIKSGTRLTVLESNDDGWSRVQTGRGTEGWMPNQYLVAQQVASARIGKVVEQANNLKAQTNELKAQLQEKETALSELQNTLSELQSEKGAVDQELTSIKQVSANAISLHKQNMDFTKRNKLLQDEVDRLTALNDQLKNNQLYTWFLYGALAVFFGALLTVILPRLKPKRKYSEWN